MTVEKEPEKQIDSADSLKDKKEPIKESPKEVIKELKSEKLEQDDPMARILKYEKELEKLRKENESHISKMKEMEKGQKKAALLSAVIDEFPSISRQEIRGAALVAAEDGHIDLFGDDPKPAIDYLKEALKGKSIKAKSSAGTSNLGGSPGTIGKPKEQKRRLTL